MEKHDESIDIVPGKFRMYRLRYMHWTLCIVIKNLEIKRGSHAA